MERLLVPTPWNTFKLWHIFYAQINNFIYLTWDIWGTFYLIENWVFKNYTLIWKLVDKKKNINELNKGEHRLNEYKHHYNFIVLLKVHITALTNANIMIIRKEGIFSG